MVASSRPKLSKLPPQRQAIIGFSAFLFVSGTRIRVPAAALTASSFPLLFFPSARLRVPLLRLPYVFVLADRLPQKAKPEGIPVIVF
jgi:hypothetical protein